MLFSSIRWLRLFVQKRAATILVFGLTLGAVAAGALVGQRQAGGQPARQRRDGAGAGRRPVPDPRLVEIEALERALNGRPRDLAAATRVARLCIEAARREADPRYLGRAQAALSPWWTEAAPADDEVLRLRAIIRQARHDFDGALADLDRLVARSPLDAQAHLVRAGLLVLRGQPERARVSCQALAPLVSPLTVAACLAPLDAAAGKTAAAAAALEGSLSRAPESERAWGLSVLGEIRFWAGDLPAAERALRRSLALDAGDRYTRALLADVLLDAGRPADVRALLGGIGVERPGRSPAAATGDAPSTGWGAGRPGNWRRSCGSASPPNAAGVKTCTAGRRPGFCWRSMDSRRWRWRRPPATGRRSASTGMRGC